MYRLKNYWLVFLFTILFLYWLPAFVDWSIDGMEMLWTALSALRN